MRHIFGAGGVSAKAAECGGKATGPAAVGRAGQRALGRPHPLLLQTLKRCHPDLRPGTYRVSDPIFI